MRNRPLQGPTDHYVIYANECLPTAWKCTHIGKRSQIGCHSNDEHATDQNNKNAVEWKIWDTKIACSGPFHVDFGNPSQIPQSNYLHHLRPIELWILPTPTFFLMPTLDDVSLIWCCGENSRAVALKAKSWLARISKKANCIMWSDCARQRSECGGNRSSSIWFGRESGRRSLSRSHRSGSSSSGAQARNGTLCSL